jgi:hypothetical protein
MSASCESSVCEGYRSTPGPSEIDLLEYYQDMALKLYVGNCTGRVGIASSIHWRAMFDTCPGAGEFYRDLVLRHPLRELVVMRYGAFLAGQAARGHREKRGKGKARHGS